MQFSNLPLHSVYLFFLFTTWITTTQASPICSRNTTLSSMLPSSLSQNATQSRRPGRISINYLVPGTSTLLIVTQELHGQPMPVRPTIALLASAGTQLEAEAANAGGISKPLTEGFVHPSQGLVVDAWEVHPQNPQARLTYDNVFAVLVGLRVTMNGLEYMESEFEIHVETQAGRVRVGTGMIGVNGPGLGVEGGVEGCFEAGAVGISEVQLTA
ncbi:MAG: hypothetical protein OHK93_002443 [Ramalina farinacea]|uniref:Uncharacterized protein n=1 Tax=Ramalina farinacea TaxID=258253 RepID=A0AA43TTS3_9LECA|nr:hypothetical protein [Ramalina farinacea]